MFKGEEKVSRHGLNGKTVEVSLFSSIYMIRVAMPYINRQLHRGFNKVDTSADEFFWRCK